MVSLVAWNCAIETVSNKTALPQKWKGGVRAFQTFLSKEKLEREHRLVAAATTATASIHFTAAATATAAAQTATQTIQQPESATGTAGATAGRALSFTARLHWNLTAHFLGDVLGATNFLLVRNAVRNQTLALIRNFLHHMASIGFSAGAGLAHIGGHFAGDSTRNALVSGVAAGVRTHFADLLAASYRIALGHPVGAPVFDGAGSGARRTRIAATIAAAHPVDAVAQGFQRSGNLFAGPVATVHSFALHDSDSSVSVVRLHDRTGLLNRDAIIHGFADFLDNRLANHGGHLTSFGNGLANALVSGVALFLANSLVERFHDFAGHRNALVGHDGSHSRSTTSRCGRGAATLVAMSADRKSAGGNNETDHQKDADRS